MKRYYTIDFVAMTEAGLNPTKWMICENIHFIQAVTESGFCEDARADLAEHHDISLVQYKKLIGVLINEGYLKRNKKNHLRTTQKWHVLIGVKKETVQQKERIKKDTPTYQKGYARRIKKDTVQPIRENLDRVREKKEKEKEKKSVELPNILKDWIEYRLEIKKPIREITIRTLLKQYKQDPIEFERKVTHSIANGYQGLFSPNEKKHTGLQKSYDAVDAYFDKHPTNTVDVEVLE